MSQVEYLTYLPSVIVTQNCHSASTINQELVKMNGHMFRKLLGCHCRFFVIHNKAHNKSCKGFTLYESALIKIGKWMAFSTNTIVIEKIIFHFRSQVLSICLNLLVVDIWATWHTFRPQSQKSKGKLPWKNFL